MLDIATVTGLVLAFVALCIANSLEGGTLANLSSLPAALIVFGGSFGAAMIMQPLRNTLMLPAVLKKAMVNRPPDPIKIINTMSQLARIARRDGLLALERELDSIDHEFLRRGVQLVVDGTDPEATEDVLQTQIYALEQRHQKAAEFFQNMGGLTPTLGVTGTVMGLIHVLSHLDTPANLGPAVATAFLATLYGVASANIVFIPIARKLQTRSEQEVYARQIIAAGVSSLQSGETPTVLRQHLKAYLSAEKRAQMSEDDKSDISQELLQQDETAETAKAA